MICRVCSRTDEDCEFFRPESENICVTCHREEAREYRRRYYKNNKERVLNDKKIWIEKNRARYNKYQRDYRRKKLSYQEEYKYA